MTQAFRLCLPSVEQMRTRVEKGHVSQPLFVTPNFKHSGKQWVIVKMVLDGALAAPGYDQNLAHTGTLQLFHHMLHDRLASYR
jgi:hypothetical protein